MRSPPILPGRLRRRLTVAFVLVAGVSAGLLALGSYLLVRDARFDDSLQRSAVDARYQLVLAGQFRPFDQERSAGLLASFAGSGRQVVLLTAGATVASEPAVGVTPGAGTRAGAAAGRLMFERSAGPARRHLLMVGGRIPGSAAELYLLSDEGPIHADLVQLRNVLLAGWASVLIVAALVGHLLARRTLDPVGRASEAARAVAEGLLDTRLPVGTRDEFGAWAMSFNRMAEALGAKITALSAAQDRERRFTADVSHELRTPVTTLVTAASLLREHLDGLPDAARRPAELLVTDVVRLRRLLEDLVEISRLDAGRESLSPAQVDLAALLAAIVEHRGWADKVRCDVAAVTVVTDARRLERVLANLLSNAVVHGGGRAWVTASADDGAVTVRVADRGPGIAAEHLPHLFERFYKADPARGGPGSGLGLAIAAENARLLGLSIQVRTEVGAGTEFRVTLPTAWRPVTEWLPAGEGAVSGDEDREAPPPTSGGPSCTR